MDSIVIEGGFPLKGSIGVSPAKNAVLPLMTASLLAKGTSTLRRSPKLADVRTLGRLLSHQGAVVSAEGAGLSIDTKNITNLDAPYELVKTMRASVLVLGPLVGRYGEARVSLPGGCAIGARPIDQHLKGLEKLGAKVELEHGYVKVSASRLRGGHIVFDMVTVTGTENLLMAAVLAKGTTVLENCAREPEVSDLAHCLVSMGAKIEGIGASLMTVEGVDELSPFSYDPVGDRIEMGTFMIASAITGGDVTITGGRLEHLDALADKLTETGVRITPLPGGAVSVVGSRRIKSVDVVTSPFPGFPTDMQAQFMALMALGDGMSVISERIFENRYMHVPELQRMGADIRLERGSAVIRGVKKLSGAKVMATDLRASAALVLAALAAEGETTVSRVYHLDRGYERIEEKLSAIGAKIRRVSEAK
ncbi:UDP-N-acetylglucosamine 1-carboxyvinyltransferase [bacterium]|nr:MAG: UDP-N-acetylglucosamine 1-carboxyvinyltransferase [bacterium]